MNAGRHLTRTAVHGLPKHERLDDLLGGSADPAPRKTRRIEWVGETSPLDDPAIAFLLTTDRLPPAVRRGIRLAAARANTRSGYRRRLLEHSHPLSLAPVPGLGRSYVWSPANGYVQDVDFRDAEVILGLPCAHEFRDLDGPPAEAPAPPLSPLVLTGVTGVRPGDVAAGTVVAEGHGTDDDHGLGPHARERTQS